MYLIAGLGNPGKEYENTRHNAGFMVIDRLADMLGCEVTGRKFRGFVGDGRIGAEKVVLLNPLTNILMMFRDVMINGLIFDVWSLVIAIVETAFFLALGLYVFYKNQDQFILNI